VKTIPPDAREQRRRDATIRTAWHLATLALLQISQGCMGPVQRDTEDSAPPFSFRSLDLQQRTKEGLPAWSLKSPEARYNIRSSVARALRPEGVIYAKGKPLYRLAATTGTVVNDGEVILLEGTIRLQRLGSQPLMVVADRALWIPRDSLMRFALQPRVRDARNRLSSETATLHLDRDLLELRGKPLLERWSQPIPLSAVPRPGQLELVGRVTTLDWQPSKGTLVGQGPVTIRRRPPHSSPQAPLQVLTASRLEGNTLQQRYTLQGPVGIDAPAEGGWFRGGTLIFDTKEQWLTSAVPFQGQKGTLRFRGDALRLDGRQTTARIERNCQLEQAGDGLQAQRCQWNWSNQGMEAEGDVQFRRQANRQLTRAQRLTGRLGPSGGVTASTPGGRVITRVQVPRQTGGPSRPRVPAKPEPIAF
jgi:LPS export ABC transporter protein LptC